MTRRPRLSLFFFFNDTATTEIYTLSLHDALPIYLGDHQGAQQQAPAPASRGLAAVLAQAGAEVRLRAREGRHQADQRVDHQDRQQRIGEQDRKSTRLNSSHQIISYAVFCLKKKKN